MADDRLELLSGKKLNELNTAEARGWIIDKMNQVESNLDSKISDYFKPENKNEFEQIILNSAVINIGSKMKILTSCELLDKATISYIREMNSIRNGFAHTTFIPTAELQTDGKNTEVKASYHSIKVMNSQGELKDKKVHKHIKRFHKLNKKVREAL